MAITGLFTYSGDPSDSNRDAVRFLVRDTNEATAQLSDEEIEWMLSENGNNVYLAAVQSVDYIANTYATQARSRTVGALSISYEARADEYRKLGMALRQRWATFTTITPYAGGISRSDKRTNEQDTDWDKPDFVRHMQENPGARTDARELSVSST